MEFTMQTRLSLTPTLGLSSVGKTGATSLTLLKEIFGKNGLQRLLKVGLGPHLQDLPQPQSICSESFTKASRRCG